MESQALPLQGIRVMARPTTKELTSPHAGESDDLQRPCCKQNTHSLERLTNSLRLSPNGLYRSDIGIGAAEVVVGGCISFCKVRNIAPEAGKQTNFGRIMLLTTH